MNREDILHIKPDYTVRFHQGNKTIGVLDFNGPAMIFTGDAEESARLFIASLSHAFSARLEQERVAEREACAKVCEQSDEDGEGPDCWGWHSKDYAAAIRARGQA